MNNAIIIALTQSGITNIDYSQLKPEASYKVYRFIRAVKKALADYYEQFGEIVKNALGEDGQAQAEELERAGKTDTPEYAALQEKVAPLLAELRNADADIEAKPKLNPEQYFALKAANPAILTNAADELLEGILWQDTDTEKAE